MKARACIPLLLLGLACKLPTVVANSQDDRFQLPMLREARVAVWPVTVAELSDDATRKIGKEFGSRDRFLDTLSNDFSTAVLQLTKAGSVDSGHVLAALQADEKGRALLDPDQVLGVQNSSYRFASKDSGNLEALARLELLKGVKYVLVPRALTIGVGPTYSNGGGAIVGGGHRGGAVFVEGGGSTSQTDTRLSLVVLDLESRSVVWDGAVFNNETNARDQEERLGESFRKEVLGEK